MLFLIASILIALASATENLRVNLGNEPMQNPDLFGGDMLGVDVTDRNAIPQPHLKWPGAKIPYVVDEAISRYSKHILKAMENYHQNTCVRFVPRTTEVNYVRLFAGQGCYSNVGMIGGQQPVSLGQGCMFKGTIVHELGHALGFFHEQNRSDRDEYLTINWQNIMTGKDTQFLLMKPHENLILDTFDYNSIMLYGNTAFSKDGRSKTMVAKSGVRLYDTFDKPGLSNSDIIRIKKLYC